MRAVCQDLRCGLRLLEGRDFTDHDDRNAALVLIVNESFAHRFFPGTNPIGRKVLNRGCPN